MLKFTKDMRVQTMHGPREFKQGEQPEHLREDILQDLQRTGVVEQEQKQEQQAEESSLKKRGRKMLRGNYENKADAVRENK